MSGPKVVRIVTREEILEICHGQLARVDAALAEWTRVGRRNDCVDEEAIAASVRRRDALAALIADDRFMDLQKQAPIEEAFLRDDLQDRLEKVAADQATERSRERRGQQAAQTLVRRLEALGKPVDAEVLTALRRGDTKALAKGFELLADAGSGTSKISGLAARLKDGPSQTTFAQWLSSQPQAPMDPQIERIESRLDQLGLLVSRSDLDRWQKRLAEAKEAASARRDLLIDGLDVETGRALSEARRHAKLREELMLLEAEVSASQPGTCMALDIENLDATALEQEISRLQGMLTKARQVHAAAARRAAVLEGLASLGYEVTEGMSTSLAENGQLVVRSAARPDYGVEVSTASGTERMQMRPVAFGAVGVGPDLQRDRDAETIWCGDVSSLQDFLAQAGGGLAIERALPIGATPLKRIAVERDAAGGATVEKPILSGRTIGQ